MDLLPPTGLKDTLAVLAALITPAILILASASLASSTSSRLANIVGRTREVVAAYRDLNRERRQGLEQHEREALTADIERATYRSRLLQRALFYQYVAIMVFIATSAGLGLSAVWIRSLAWLWILSALAGAVILLYSALLLVRDSRSGMEAVETEMLGILKEAGLEERRPHSLVDRLRRLA